jgi:hypothetical protein
MQPTMNHSRFVISSSTPPIRVSSPRASWCSRALPLILAEGRHQRVGDLSRYASRLTRYPRILSDTGYRSTAASCYLPIPSSSSWPSTYQRLRGLHIAEVCPGILAKVEYGSGVIGSRSIFFRTEASQIATLSI